MVTADFAILVSRNGNGIHAGVKSCPTVPPFAKGGRKGGPPAKWKGINAIVIMPTLRQRRVKGWATRERGAPRDSCKLRRQPKR